MPSICLSYHHQNDQVPLWTVIFLFGGPGGIYDRSFTMIVAQELPHKKRWVGEFSEGYIISVLEILYFLGLNTRFHWLGYGKYHGRKRSPLDGCSILSSSNVLARTTVQPGKNDRNYDYIRFIHGFFFSWRPPKKWELTDG